MQVVSRLYCLCLGASTLQAVAKNRIGGFLAKRDAARVIVYDVSSESRPIHPGGVTFGISVTAVVPSEAATPIYGFGPSSSQYISLLGEACCTKLPFAESPFGDCQNFEEPPVAKKLGHRIRADVDGSFLDGWLAEYLRMPCKCIKPPPPRCPSDTCEHPAK